jgi:hypothetical protein
MYNRVHTDGIGIIVSTADCAYKNDDKGGGWRTDRRAIERMNDISVITGDKTTRLSK